MELKALILELERRRVFRALVAYGILAFAILQIIEPVMHGLHWPDAVLSYVVVTLGLGFPVVVSLAWIFDVREGRLQKSHPVQGAGLRGWRLALVLTAIGVAAAAPGIAWNFFWRTRPPERDPAPSIAVLPFADMSPGKDQEYFSDGIAEEILNALAHIEGLRVAGRTSSFSFKGKHEDLRSISAKLNVRHVLEGSVRRDGDRVRVNAQLVDASDGYHRWSAAYERDLKGIFALEDEIARAIVAALAPKLMPAAAAPERLARRSCRRRGRPRSKPSNSTSAAPRRTTRSRAFICTIGTGRPRSANCGALSSCARSIRAPGIGTVCC